MRCQNTPGEVLSAHSLHKTGAPPRVCTRGPARDVVPGLFFGSRTLDASRARVTRSSECDCELHVALQECPLHQDDTGPKPSPSVRPPVHGNSADSQRKTKTCQREKRHRALL